MAEDKYLKEYMDYLHIHGAGEDKIFDVENGNISEFEKSIITTVSDSIIELLKKMSMSRELDPIINVYCMDNDDVNAFCFVVNKHYYIGMNSGTYIELLKRTELLADYIVNDGNLGYCVEDVGSLQASIWIYAFKLILTHEYMHIILGHCDFTCGSESFLWERTPKAESPNNNYKPNKERQALEMFADEFASIDAATQIMYFADGSVENIKKELLKYYLAVMLVFSIFDDEGDGQFDNHPRLGVRLHYITATVDDIIYKHLDKPADEASELLEEINSVIEDFMDIIKVVPDVFSYDIVKALGVSEVDKDYIELYNIASDVVKQTNSYAIYPLEEFEKKAETYLISVNEERRILKDAAVQGLSYEETRRKILNN